MKWQIYTDSWYWVQSGHPVGWAVHLRLGGNLPPPLKAVVGGLLAHLHALRSPANTGSSDLLFPYANLCGTGSASPNGLTRPQATIKSPPNPLGQGPLTQRQDWTLQCLVGYTNKFS